MTQRCTPMQRERFTPVRGDAGVDSPDAYAHYLPFPVAAVPRPREYARRGEARILCVGKLNQPRKQHFMLPEALERLVGTAEFQVTLAGSALHPPAAAASKYYERLQTYARRGSLGDRVTIRANLPFRQMPDLCLCSAVAP